MRPCDVTMLPRGVRRDRMTLRRDRVTLRRDRAEFIPLFHTLMFELVRSQVPFWPARAHAAHACAAACALSLSLSVPTTRATVCYPCAISLSLLQRQREPETLHALYALSTVGAYVTCP